MTSSLFSFLIMRGQEGDSMNKKNLYLNIIACSLVIWTSLFLVAISFIAGGALVALFTILLAFVPTASFAKELYDNVKKFES